MVASDSTLRAINEARIVTSGGVLEGASIILEEGRIAGISAQAETSGETLDAAGRYVLPGIVDLHTDVLERQAMPRPGVRLPATGAFLEADRQLALVGITTAFDAVAFMDADPRGVERAKELCEAVLYLREGALVRHELHARCELPQKSSVEAVIPLLGGGGTRLVSVMDHTPGRGQFADLASYESFYREVRGADDKGYEAALEELRHGGGLSLVGRFDELSRVAREASVVLASHDDHSVEHVGAVARRGGSISEFPVNLAAARGAKELGLSVCLGAPNALRGCSSSGNLSAVEAIKLGLVDALCSDYHPPAMLHAAFRLAREGVLSLPEAVDFVSSGPSRAVGFHRRGEIREGAAADLILVGEWFGLPTVTHTIRGGMIVASSYPTR
jgi:alpha-D-ribose 1-methylphosphonate 5-triphosphate diphosphatase